MDFTADVHGDMGASLSLNGAMLVGAVVDGDTGQVAIGYWPDGEEWVELFRVKADWP